MTEETPRVERARLAPPARTFRLTLLQVTSVLVITTRETRVLSVGSHGNFRGFYREVLLHNLLLGWWGFPFGLIWTPIALVRNQRAQARLRELMSQAAGAGWYLDPVGQHQSRYWDGTQWTAQVRDTLVTSDPPAAG